jgi:hypothetical protein
MICLVPKLTQDEQTCLWVRKNRGVCASIARSLEVSSEFVRMILYRTDPNLKSAGLRVERALFEAGAPFMQERIREFDSDAS